MSSQNVNEDCCFSLVTSNQSLDLQASSKMEVSHISPSIAIASLIFMPTPPVVLLWSCAARSHGSGLLHAHGRPCRRRQCVNSCHGSITSRVMHGSPLGSGLRALSRRPAMSPWDRSACGSFSGFVMVAAFFSFASGVAWLGLLALVLLAS